MCGAACEAVAINREQSATKQIHLPPWGVKKADSIEKNDQT